MAYRIPESDAGDGDPEEALVNLFDDPDPLPAQSEYENQSDDGGLESAAVGASAAVSNVELLPASVESVHSGSIAGDLDSEHEVPGRPPPSQSNPDPVTFERPRRARRKPSYLVDYVLQGDEGSGSD